MTRFTSRAGEHVASAVESLGGERRRVIVDGTSFDLDLIALGPATFAWRHGGRVERFHAIREGKVLHLAWRGAVYRLEESDEDAPLAHRGGHGALEAPMPGKVAAVNVVVGQHVTKGQEILVVEA